MIVSIGEKIPTGYFKNPAGNSRKFIRIIFSLRVKIFLKKFNSSRYFSIGNENVQLGFNLKRLCPHWKFIFSVRCLNPI